MIWMTYSANEDSYEGVTLSTSTAYLKNQIPERLGSYFCENVSGTIPATIEYLYRLYSLKDQTLHCERIIPDTPCKKAPGYVLF